MQMLTYRLSEFSHTPFGRYPDDGKFNGTKFRDVLVEKLNQAREQKDTLNLIIDLTNYGIGSSFLEESFGGLVRKGYFKKEELIGSNSLLSIDSKFTFYIDEINQYISEATPE